MKGRRHASIVLASIGVSGAAIGACAQILDVEPGTLQSDGGSGLPFDSALDESFPDRTSALDGGSDVFDEGVSPAADAGPEGAAVDATLDVQADATLDVQADATPPCDPADSDAATGGFTAWYPVGDAVFPPGANLAGVSPTPGEIAFFGVRRDGVVVMSRASSPFGAAAWSPWAPVTTDATTFAAGASVSAVARGAGRTEVFIVRADGTVVETAAGMNEPWSMVGGGARSFPSQRVGLALSGSAATTLHVFGASGGAVYEASEDPDGGMLSSWQPVGGGDAGISFAPDAPVAVVARSPVMMDAFEIGADGLVYASSRSFAPTDTGWSPWSALESKTFSTATVLTASSHVPSEFDLFAVDLQGTPSAILHNDDWPDGGWVGWFGFGGQALAGTHVVAVSSMDLYMIDPTGEVMTLPFDQQAFRWPAGWVPISPCGASVGASSIEAVRGIGTAIELAAVGPNGQVFVADRTPSP